MSFYFEQETDQNLLYPVSKKVGETELNLSMSFYRTSFCGMASYCMRGEGEKVEREREGRGRGSV